MNADSVVTSEYLLLGVGPYSRCETLKSAFVGQGVWGSDRQYASATALLM